MKRIALGLIIGLLLLSGVVRGASISYYRREAEVGLDGTGVEDTVIFNEAPGTLEIPFFFNVKNFDSRSTLSEHSCEVSDKQYGSLIACNLPQDESGRLSLEFDTNELVRDTSKHYYFEDDLDVPLDTEKVIYNVRLSEGLVLIDEDLNTPFQRFSPSYGKQSSDGRRIYVIWSQENVSEGEGVRPQVSFERSRENGGMGGGYVVVIGILLILGFLAFAALSGGKDNDKMPEALKKDEREILKIVKDSGGEIKQKRIVDAVDFSKAKVSRMVQDLKERGLLETEKVGRTNRVRLTGD